MLKKIGAAAAAATGLMMIAAPAMAGEDGPSWAGAHWNNGPFLSAVNANNLNGVIGVCGNNVGVFGGAVPINSPVFVDNCAAGGINDGDDVNFEG